MNKIKVNARKWAKQTWSNIWPCRGLRGVVLMARFCQTVNLENAKNYCDKSGNFMDERTQADYF